MSRQGTAAAHPDMIETLGQSTIQHGEYNDRLYLMDLAPEDYPSIVGSIEKICSEKEYGKSFAVVPESLNQGFMENEYREEARVPGFFSREEDGVFLGKYFDTQRSTEPEESLRIFRRVMSSHRKIFPGRLGGRFRFARMKSSDLEEMAELYRGIFPDYPFPIGDPAYLSKTMKSKTLYVGIREGKRLVALASAELNQRARAAEMTDFAVLPEYRGQRLGSHLLRILERAAEERGILTAYTIARLDSLGMNTVFRRGGYEYAGTLINNTRISSGIESMNVWYKALNRS